MTKKMYIDLDIPEQSLFNLKNINYTNLPQRIIKSLQEVKPDNILIINEKPIILFFHRDNEILNEIDGKQKVFKNCWNFAEAPIIIIEKEIEFEVYNGFEFITQSKSLDTLPKNNLNYISILNGDYFKELKTKKENKRINKFLLENIKYTRDELLKEGLKEYKSIANSLIGRIIFIRYLIDRNVYLNKYNKALTNDDLKEILEDKIKTYELFEYLKNSFNGDWFPIIHDDKNKIYEKDIVNEVHLKSLYKLISGYDYKKGMGSLFDIYDFSIIPIEFISNVYESFIGENEQKESGAYYTPTFLVDYILKYTVDDFFEKNPNSYNCKVLDPACGSGIFLVETLRKLVAQFVKIKKRPIEENELKQLVKDNIFGIDKDENAISISVFSLYLAMLDYQNPKELDKFKFPNLLLSENNPNPNFFANDFFDTNTSYNHILKEKKLDFIIGNPPYGGSTIKKDSFINRYIQQNKISIGNEDIVQPFMIRVRDFVDKKTKISFIVTSKVLYNLNNEEFRTKHFFNNFKVNHILELSSVRKEIFENANVPVSIIFYKKSTKEEIANNIIKYISMKPTIYFKKLKILILTKQDLKKISQSKLLKNDYLWKILLYGSYLDFNFIKRIQSKEYTTIQNLEDEKQLIKYQGFKRKDGNKKINTEELKDFDFIDTGSTKKDLKPFYIAKNLTKFTYDSVGYVKREKGNYANFFKPPILLFTGGLSKELKQNSAICYKNATFTSSVVALKHFNNDINVLKTINGLFYSSFFSYYLLQTASSTGVRQEECDDYEKLSIPYIENEKIVSLVSEIENLKKEYLDNNELKNPYEYENKLDILISNLDETVLKTFSLNEEEHALVDYANNIIIPWIIQKKYEIAFKKIPYENEILKQYISIFINHYSKIYEQSNTYFQANVLWDNYAIGIYFRVLNKKPEKIITWKKEKNIQKFLEISGKQTLENLFIQKDIKGFEKDGFYVVKPNEHKNWHKAIGYLDFYEFNDAILKAGKNKWMN
ncbi:class I SAM-dependent DNA methyltransferase [Aliarcobacter butzleri]|uniref:HsdM family class I SAM-dependent methyltransferase n=1 Tax=Aliarcobacter butzleri TaxID=28197 RepID=UPI001EDA6FBE|nr:DNA methyltransferase [Aliarcobacter butzleri]MCG3692594.1 Eco57I restriction-modification methylase domain-containing protein [Aliarcobacter butzleri]